MDRESDVEITAGSGLSSGKMAVRTDGVAGKGPAHVGKREVKDAKTVVSAAEDQVVGHTQKDGMGAAKAPTGAVASSEVQALAGSATVPVVHGAMGLTASPGDAVAGVRQAKTHVEAANSSVVRVQDEPGAVATVPSPEGHRTLTATPTTLEVGVANGTHGWLKVRAEMTSGGVVNASLSAASSSGHEMLHRELPFLTAYLQEERVGVNAVVLHASAAEAGSRQSSGGMDADAGRGQMQQNGGQSRDGGQSSETAVLSDRSDEAVSFEGLNGMGAAGWLAPAIYAGGATGSGGWLSVRA
jgi:hypothetical protein